MYKIQFMQQGELYEIYAENFYQGAIFGFIEIEGMQFGHHSSLVVDPSEERLKQEFEGVKRIFVPMHAVVRIDEVDKQGSAKISSVDSKVTQFPTPVYTPKGEQ